MRVHIKYVNLFFFVIALLAFSAFELKLTRASSNTDICQISRLEYLSKSNITLIIKQAVTKATSLNVKATIAVTDREANVLAVYKMKGASHFTRILTGPLSSKLIPSEFAAISKAGTCSLFGTTGNAFSTRSAGFIVQEHFPPGIDFTPAGPLFGVQFSSLPFSDINPKLPLGLSADPGGLPLFKNGIPVGGIGVELDNVYGIDKEPNDFDQSIEEIIAAAGTTTFETPSLIQADNIFADGIRLPFTNSSPSINGQLLNLNEKVGKFINTPFNPTEEIINGIPYLGNGSNFKCSMLQDKIVRVAISIDDKERFPIKSSQELSTSEVKTVLSQAIDQAYKTRAAIRQPLGSFAEVNVAIVGLDGQVLGIIATPDAPLFGFDVSVQKARTALLFSRSDCAVILNKQKLGQYVDATNADGINLNGSTAFTSRGVGFLARPFFPDGINNTENGPLSVSSNQFSPFNVGIQLNLILPTLTAILNKESNPPLPPTIVRNGLQIFAGGIPLYKGNKLVGAIGISGDGIDQDDLIAAKGAVGFEAPTNMRCDQLFVRKVRLPWVKFPRHPEL